MTGKRCLAVERCQYTNACTHDNCFVEDLVEDPFFQPPAGDNPVTVTWRWYTCPACDTLDWRHDADGTPACQHCGNFMEASNR